MTQSNEKPQYLYCSGCSVKFINDDEHIKIDFGYNRLNDRFKSCVTCRERYAKHREGNREERRASAQIYYKNNKEYILECKKQYREENKDKIYQNNKEKITCETCGS